MMGYLTTKVSRAQLIAAAGAGIGLAALPAGAGAQTATMTESTQQIFNVADTAEHLAITLLTAAVNAASALGLKDLTLAIVQAALAEEVFHADFLEANGATSATNTFTVPNPALLTDYNTFFSTLVTLEAAFVAAYLRATTEFSMAGNQTLAQYTYQIGGVEAEHRTLARAALALNGQTADIPPNNLAFESDLFLTVADAATALTNLGFIGGTGTQVTYPGRGTALAAAGSVVSSITDQKPS